MLHLFYDMRVLTTFFTIVIVLLLLGIGGFFLAREILLYWGINSFKASLDNLAQQAQNGSYAGRCQAENDLYVADLQIQTQLRFTSDTEYVIEATCSHLSTKPILIKKNHLPPYITKVPGGSGIIWGNMRSAVELEVFHGLVEEIAKVINMNVSFLEKRKIVGIENKIVIVQSKHDDTDLGEGPVTSCEGYGYQCCKADTQVGVGESIMGLAECSDSCYSSCSSRPVVLSFTTTPLYNVTSRELLISSGAMVDFNYVVDAPESSTVQVSVDFGDGSPQASLNEESGKLTHQYKCAFPTCTYTARISVVDNWQVTSYENSAISKITVAVSGQ